MRAGGGVDRLAGAGRRFEAAAGGAGRLWGFAVVAGLRRAAGAGLVPRPGQHRGGDGVRAAAAACLIAVLVAKIAGPPAHERAPPLALAREPVGHRAGAAAADRHLRLPGGAGRGDLAGFPAGLRAGQLPGHLPPPGGGHPAGAGGHRPGGGHGLRAGRRARRRPRCSPGHVVFIVIFAGAERGLPARRGGAPAARAPPPPGDRGGQHARGGARLPPDLHRPAQREPGAHPRRGRGEAVAGVDRDHPPAAVRHPGPAAQVAGAADLRPAVAGRRRREAEAQGGGQRRAAAGRGARSRRAPACSGPSSRSASRCCLEAPRPQLLPYYEAPVEVDAFLGVPVVEGRTAARASWWSTGAAGAAFDAARDRAGGQRRRPGDAHRAVRAGVPGGRALASTSTSASTRPRRRSTGR